MAFSDDIKRIYQTGGISIKTIMIFAVIFVTTLILNFIVVSVNRQGLSIQENLSWLAGTAHLPSLFFKPWTIFTNILIHDGPRHFFGNMIGIYFFGRVLSQFMSDKDYTATFLLSGITGFLVYVVFFNLLHVLGVFEGSLVGSSIVGASGCVMGILGASVAYAPMMRFNMIIVQPPLILIAGIYVLIDLSTISTFSNNLGGSVAHVAGLAFGYLAVKFKQDGKDILSWFTRLLNRLTALFAGKSNPRGKMKVKYRNKDFKSKNKSKRTTTKTDADYNVQKVDRQAKIDAILDKIKRSGYESLSKAEKDYLFNEGKRL